MKTKASITVSSQKKAIDPQGGQIASQLSYNWKLCTKSILHKLSILLLYISAYILKDTTKAHHYKISVTMQIVVS